MDGGAAPASAHRPCFDLIPLLIYFYNAITKSKDNNITIHKQPQNKNTAIMVKAGTSRGAEADQSKGVELVYLDKQE